MVNLRMCVKGQHLRKVDGDFLANRSMNVLVLSVEFDNEWDGFTKYGIFNSNSKSYRAIPQFNEGYYEFTVPTEVLMDNGFYCTFAGCTSENDEIITRITTNKVYVSLNDSGFTRKLENGSFEEVDEEAIESLFSVVYTKAEVDEDFARKSDVPTKISDLTNDSDFIETSSTTGLIKNDGTIDTSTYLTESAASSTYVTQENGANTLKDSSAYSNIGTSSNATQKQINNAIDAKISEILTRVGNCEDLIGE